MVGWIRMPLGAEVGLGRGDIVLDGYPASLPHRKGTAAAPAICGQRLLLPNSRPSEQNIVICFVGKIYCSFEILALVRFNMTAVTFSYLRSLASLLCSILPVTSY